MWLYPQNAINPFQKFESTNLKNLRGSCLPSAGEFGAQICSRSTGRSREHCRGNSIVSLPIPVSDNFNNLGFSSLWENEGFYFFREGHYVFYSYAADNPG